MIVFDLVCGGGHVFEAWFGSTADYEGQQARGLVACPMCGSEEVDKAPMTPRLGAKGNQRVERRAPAAMTNNSMVAMKEMLRAMAAAQAKALEASDYVGSRFADEARAIHLGESKARSIHGQATADDARALVDEGIEVAPLPFPVRPPGVDN
jgi:hypothetical protein